MHSSFEQHSRHPIGRRLGIGIAGLGTVGSAVARALSNLQGLPLVLRAVSTRRPDVPRDIGHHPNLRWVSNAIELVGASDIDIVVEAIGGSEGVALDLAMASLSAGKAVVSANKAMLAYHGEKLAECAANTATPLRYEAAVAGGVPIVRAMLRLTECTRIQSVEAVLNGTCNFIVSGMETGGGDFDEALQLAQERGFAEADPTLDISGEDAAHKLAILSALAFGGAPRMDELSFEGIAAITQQDIRDAQKRDKKIRLISSSVIEGTHRSSSVKLREIDKNHPFALLEGTQNQIIVNCDGVGDIVMSGHGAGGDVTASAIMADLLDIAEYGLRDSRPVFGTQASLISRVCESS